MDTDAQKSSKDNRGAIRKLRHRGKTRHRKDTAENRGKITISNAIHERPAEANERKIIGHWEADTVIGKKGSACLVTITDRCSRYLLAEKIHKKQAQNLADKMKDMFRKIPNKYVKTITPDRGKEFAKHTDVTEKLGGVQFYFADPHGTMAKRGTNENTNGLLREYFPKSFDFASCSNEDITAFVDKINKRPRKCLNWLSPFELFFNTVLHLT